MQPCHWASCDKDLRESLPRTRIFLATLSHPNSRDTAVLADFPLIDVFIRTHRSSARAGPGLMCIRRNNTRIFPCSGIVRGKWREAKATRAGTSNQGRSAGDAPGCSQSNNVSLRKSDSSLYDPSSSSYSGFFCGFNPCCSSLIIPRTG